MYASTTWNSGAYVDLSLAGQVARAKIHAEDGFSETITGSSLALSTRIGHPYRLGSDWILEPQVQVSVTASHWGDTVDASGKDLVLADDVFGTARASLRLEKTFVTASGGTVRPWLTLGVQNILGETNEALNIALPGTDGEVQAFPAHDLGTSASLDLGVEAKLREGISLFGVASYGRSVSGSDHEERAVNVGVRIRW